MKNLIIRFLWVFISGAIVLSGCDLAQPQNKGKEVQRIVQNDPPAVEAPQNPQQQRQNEEGAVEDNTVSVKATVGVGARGNYGNPVNSPVGMVTAPVSAYFRTQEKIAFEINFVRAMNEFKAFNDGRVPASQEEFDEKIIKPYGIKLPPLPTNHAYFYDPSDGELKVRKPKEAP